MRGFLVPIETIWKDSQEQHPAKIQTCEKEMTGDFFLFRGKSNKQRVRQTGLKVLSVHPKVAVGSVIQVALGFREHLRLGVMCQGTHENCDGEFLEAVKVKLGLR